MLIIELYSCCHELVKKKDWSNFLGVASLPDKLLLDRAKGTVFPPQRLSAVPATRRERLELEVGTDSGCPKLNDPN